MCPLFRSLVLHARGNWGRDLPLPPRESVERDEELVAQIAGCAGARLAACA